MLFKVTALLLLATSSLAHPKRHEHLHRVRSSDSDLLIVRSEEEFPKRDDNGSDDCTEHKHHHHHPVFTASPDPPPGVSPQDDSEEITTVTSTMFLTVTVPGPQERDVPPATTGPDGAQFYQRSYPTTLATYMVPSAAIPSGVPTGVPAASPAASTGGKRGLAYNVPGLTDIFAGQGMSWAYNWANAPGGTIASGLEYVPQLWGLNSVSGWSSAASAAIAAGSGHVLSFNEPDLPSQSNMSPSEAASNHIQYMNPLTGKAEIGSPAITNGGGSDQGINWLTQFFEACDGQCKVDFIACHWYNNPGTIADFEQHITDVISFAATQGIGKIWITEFGLNYGSDSDVESFLQAALPFLDSQPAVERYAYFMCGTDNNQLVSGSGASSIGNVYVAA